MDASDADAADNTHPGYGEDRLIALAAAYDEALARGESSSRDGVSDNTLDEASQAQLERAQRVLEGLARVRRELVPVVPESESGESISWYGVGWPLASTADAVSDEELFPRRLGRFEILRELGRGGLGVVFLAQDELLNRQVALKVPRPEVLVTPQVRERFNREAQAAARLTHPNLVPVHEVGQVGPIIYIVIAYCPGPNLAEWLRERGGSVPPNLAAQLIAPLADAVHYAHGQGVLHRDIKPSNVLLEPAPSEADRIASDGGSELSFAPKLVDFGLARVADAPGTHTRSGMAMGTFGYMAPEQAEGRLRDIGPATDVHALGAVLYQCLTGRLPYSGQSEADCLRRIVSDEPPRPSHQRYQIPRDLEAICLKCLEKLPARRYVSASELAADLRRFLAGEPTKARPLGAIDRAWRWTRRRPATAALLAVSLLAAVTVVAGSVFYTARLDRALATSEQRRIEANAMRDHAETNARIARENEARVRQHVYVADMRVAQQLGEDGDLASLAPLLDRYSTQPKKADDSTSRSTEPDSQFETTASVGAAPAAAMPFEWRYLDRFRDACRLTLDAHSGPVDMVAFAAGGTVLATSGIQDGQLRVWAIPSGQPLGSFPVRTKPLRRWEEPVAALSVDGRRVATLVDARTVVVWDVVSRTEFVRLNHDHTLLTIAFSPDGSQIAAGDEQQTILWSCENGQRISTHPAARLLAFAPGGRQLAVVGPHATNARVHLCDLPASQNEPDLTMSAAVRYVSYSPDGTMLACLSNSTQSGGICVFHVPSGVVASYVGGVHGERYNQVGFSNDSRWLVASAADGSLKFWDARTAEPVAKLRGPATRLVHFAFSADDRWLATSTPKGSVLIWDRQLLEPCAALLPENEVVGPLAFSPDGKTLAACTLDRRVVLIDADSGQIDVRLPRHVERIRDLAFSHDSTRLVTTDGQTIRCWNRQGGAQQWLVSGNRANCVCWSPRGTLIVSGGADKLIHLYDAADGANKSRWWAHCNVTGLRFLPDKPLLVSAGDDGMVRFWDTAKRARLLSEDSDIWISLRDAASGDPLVASFSAGTSVEQFALSADGRALAVGCQDGGLKVWPLGDRLDPGEPKFARSWAGAPPAAFTFAPDGQTLGMGDMQGMFQAFDLKTQQSLYTLSGRRVGATSAAYSPDGTTLATVSREGCLTLWDVSHWKTRTLAGSPPMPVRSLAFSADGNGLAIGTDDAVQHDNASNEEIPTAPNVRQFITLQSALGSLSRRPIKLDGVPWDASGPGFRVWDLADGGERKPLGQCPTLTAIPLIAWSAQGIIAAGSRDGTVWIWDTRSSQLVTRFAINPTGQAATLWKSPPGRPLITHGAIERLDAVVALAFSTDGERLAVATKSGIVQIVDTDNWEHRTTLCTDATRVACVAFSPTGAVLVANRRGQLNCWNLVDVEKSGEPRLIGREDDPELCSAMFAHDGLTLAVGRQDGTVQLLDAEPLIHWDGMVASDVPRRTLKGHLDRVVSMSFTPDDRTLATGSWDATVRLWQVASGQEVAVLKAHHGKVEAVAFSPDGAILTTGGQRDPDHGEVFLWRTTSK